MGTGMWECPGCYPVLTKSRFGDWSLCRQTLCQIDHSVMESFGGEVITWVMGLAQNLQVEGGVGPFGLLIIFTYQRKPLVLFCSDQSRSSLNQKDYDLTTYGTFLDVGPSYENLSLRSLIDHSVVESFGGEGRAVIAARVYPTLAINDEAQLYVFNYGAADVKITRLSAWSMKKAHINGD
ncbi:fructan 6-exohydrolase-like [Prosopis cineraria]|uniref:fructan 6-exohydrolase-like n=1 Tax=Prosopis cineraria TaxID=364024 RepID=UPI00240FEFA0|nr:fructan 6-exohydrolase-like [Prosopis cineraria]